MENSRLRLHALWKHVWMFWAWNNTWLETEKLGIRNVEFRVPNPRVGDFCDEKLNHCSEGMDVCCLPRVAEISNVS